MPSAKKAAKRNRRAPQTVATPAQGATPAHGDVGVVAEPTARPQSASPPRPHQVLTLNTEGLDLHEALDANSTHPLLDSINDTIAAQCNLEYALCVVEGTCTHPGICPSLYEAGVLLCFATFLAHMDRRQKGAGGLALRLCSDSQASSLFRFWHALTRALRLIHPTDPTVIPASLAISHLPSDAAHVWNNQRARLIRVVDQITIDDGHVNYVLTLYKWSDGPPVRITQLADVKVTLPVECGVCYEAAPAEDACGQGGCKYITCRACRAKMARPICPFCRRPLLTTAAR